MRFAVEKEHYGYLLRAWDQRHSERAYATLGWRPFAANIEFPSEWHERALAWVRICLGLISFNFSFPWRKVAPDHGQCSGPRYGFYFIDRQLVLLWGQDTGHSRDPRRSRHISLPWDWTHVRHSYYWPDGHLHHHAARGEYERPAETCVALPYTYVLRSGVIQNRTATVNGEEREWRWVATSWLGWPRKVRRSININFNDQVGEGTGSWKGGTLGCGYEWRHGESLEDALRRMERERKFER
jgi:hypothetical protein